MATHPSAVSMNELTIPIFCEIDNELNHELQMMYNHHTIDAWDWDDRIPPYCTVIENQTYRNEAKLFPLEYLTNGLSELRLNTKVPPVIAMTYEVSSMASFANLKATLTEVSRTAEQTRVPDSQRLKHLAHQILTHSRPASGKFQPTPPSPGSTVKFPWLLIGLIETPSSREVSPVDVQNFLSTQYGCIAAVECHPHNLEEVTAAFRPAIEEAHRQSKAKRKNEERAREEKKWMLEEEKKMSEEERRREAQNAINRMRQFEQWFGCLDKVERKGRL